MQQHHVAATPNPIVHDDCILSVLQRIGMIVARLYDVNESTIEIKT